tara:strand:- start:371 stop:1816 length:1446 start_codon:yes stop_codon:yes gene_type:complete
MSRVAAKYKREPIVSLISGYQRYVARPESRNIFSKSFKNRTPPFPLYKHNGKTVTGSYVGNHFIINRYSKVENINSRELEQFNASFKNIAVNSNNRMLNDILTRYKDKKTYDKIKVTTGGSGAPEEQARAVGGRSVPLNRPVGSAQEVDLRERFGNFQVTVQRLDDPTHHSLYGNAGKRLQKEIQDVRNKYKHQPEKEREMNQQIADKGYEYFKNRLPQWNVVLNKIQQEKRGTGPTNVSVRSAIVRQTGGSVQQLAGGAIQGMSANSTKFMTRQAAQMTSTALGNMQEFGRGVTYTFVISPFAHAALQQFKMKNQGGRLLWDESALKRNLTEVIYSYMPTDRAFRDINGGNATKYDMASRRYFAEMSNRTNKTKHETAVNTLLSQATGMERTNSGKFFPSIDMVNANKDMARHIKKVLIPTLQRELKMDAKKYTKSRIGEPIDITGGILRKGRKARLWAAPYLSVADFEFEAFGEGATFN